MIRRCEYDSSGGLHRNQGFRLWLAKAGEWVSDVFNDVALPTVTISAYIARRWGRASSRLG